MTKAVNGSTSGTGITSVSIGIEPNGSEGGEGDCYSPETSIPCGVNTYSSSTSVTVTAGVNDGQPYLFDHWESNGGCNNSSNPCTLTVNSNVSMYAHFVSSGSTPTPTSPPGATNTPTPTSPPGSTPTPTSAPPPPPPPPGPTCAPPAGITCSNIQPNSVTLNSSHGGAGPFTLYRNRCRNGDTCNPLDSQTCQNTGESCQLFNSVHLTDYTGNLSYTDNGGGNGLSPGLTYGYHAHDAGGCGVASGSCTTSTATPTPTASPTPTITPTPTQTPWVRIKNGSFYAATSFTETIPATRSTYDIDDDSSAHFIIDSENSDPGAALGNTVTINGGTVSSFGWKGTSAKRQNLTPAIFRQYVQSRKLPQTVTPSGILSNKVNILTGNFTISSAANSESNINDAFLVGRAPLVLITTGNLTINSANFNAPGNASLAVVSLGTLSFSNTTEEADGVFVATNVNTGTTATQGLKIKGNLISQNPVTNGRNWTNNTKPSLFIVNDPKHYLDLLNLFSIVAYKYNQLR